MVGPACQHIHTENDINKKKTTRGSKRNEAEKKTHIEYLKIQILKMNGEMNENENDYDRLFGQWQNDCETQIKKQSRPFNIVE